MVDFVGDIPQIKVSPLFRQTHNGKADVCGFMVRFKQCTQYTKNKLWPYVGCTQTTIFT